MKRLRILTAIAAFLLPLVVRTFWFYRGVFQPPITVATPNYEKLSVPAPPTSVDQIEISMSDTSGKVVLLDWAHDNQFGISELEELIGALNTRGAEVEIVQDSYTSGERSISERLDYASAYIVIAPESVFSTAEVQQVTRFIERGGRLLVICDPTRSQNSLNSFASGYSFGYQMGGVAAANSLLAPFDIAFSEDYLYNLLINEGNYRNVLFDNFAEEPFTESFSTVVFYGVRSISTNTGIPLITGDQDTLSSRTDRAGEWAPAIRSADGGVVALGDLTFLSPPYSEVADNPLLVNRLVEFLLSGERQRDLHDFPFLFKQPVAILETDIFGLSAETLPYISRIQSMLEAQNLTLDIVDEPLPGLDLIVPSLYQPGEEAQSFLALFEELILPKDSEDGVLIVPGFDDVNPTGIGVVLLTRTGERTILVLLANSIDELLTLVDVVADGELNDCLIRGASALCKVGGGEGFLFGDGFDYEDTDLYFDELFIEDVQLTDEPPIPTPTP